MVARTGPKKGRQGFASMDRERQREIASLGGKASHIAQKAKLAELQRLVGKANHAAAQDPTVEEKPKQKG